MAVKSWTEKQIDAITSTGGSVLVSAAAGSGKTAVLVERVIRRITDPKAHTDVNRLLIVTFTRAAAGEMRSRIAAAIEERLRAEPMNKNLINQRMLLPSAKICTIDSFCGSLVRENFQLLDIAPDFKNADEGELGLLKAQAMNMTLEQLYSGGGDFFDVVELLFKGRDDENIADMIYELYNASMSYPFPQLWLDETGAAYDESEASKSVYGRLIMAHIETSLRYCLGVISAMKNQMYGCEALEKAFLAAVESDEAQINAILERLKNDDWDAAKAAVERFEAVRRARLPKDMQELFETKFLIKSRDTVKDVIKKKIAPLMCCTQAQFAQDMLFLKPKLRCLCEAAKLFSENFTRVKREKGLADFNDIAHMALSLLIKPSGGGFEKTPLALSIARDYDEILIDEYQDTNKAQDMLFEAISRGNLFRVGDVKQSIYRFRRAMPEIFIGLKNSYAEYDRGHEVYPAKITLGNNFRSRSSVTGMVNFVFSNLMSKNMGGVDYSEDERLVCSASYPQTPDDTAELHLLDIDGIDTDEHSSDELQARYTASLINRLIDGGFTVKDGDGQRRATYRDFCVLLRSVNGGRGAVYAEQFQKSGIPCHAETSVNFFSAYEVSLTLDLLRVIDNPRQDIPLLTVLTCAVFGFSVDDMARLRLAGKKGDLYSCMLVRRDEGDEKVCAFLEKISLWRDLSVSMSIEKFIREIYDDTGLPAIVGAMKGAQARTANLELLLDYAQAYSRAGYIGLSGFIGFIDRLEREKQELPGSLGVSAEADAVRIMSIHKSKGLEFPICIVANCSGKFNRSDEINGMIISPRDGVGLIMRDTETLAQYPTVCHNAVKLSLRSDMVSEELRVLYVAMTRAREKLIMIGAVRDAEKTLARYSVNIDPASDKLAPFAVYMGGSYSEWLITALLRHKDAVKMRELAGVSDSVVLKSDFSLKTVIAKPEPDADEAPAEKRISEIDGKFFELIDSRVRYRYEYEPLTFVVSKRAASEVDRRSVDREYFASSRPAFMDGGLTPAQRGIATHTFMQYADYKQAKADVRLEIERLADRGAITPAQAQAINIPAVERFFKSDLARRMLSSENIMREKKFTVEVPIGQLYPQLSGFSDEKVMIQGIADCAFIEKGKLVIVDYKTDHLKTEEEFKEKYGGQVRIYKQALAQCTGLEVSQTLLYSFMLGRSITVD